MDLFGYTNNNQSNDSLTFDKLIEVIEKFTNIYYLSNPYIPKQLKNKEGILEDSIMAFDCYGYKVWLIHPDWLEQVKQAAIENNKKLIDFKTIQEKVMREGLEKKLTAKSLARLTEDSIREQWRKDVYNETIRFRFKRYFNLWDGDKWNT